MMPCCHYFTPAEDADTALSVDTNAITVGNGWPKEAGATRPNA
jgi:hypothetical protein